MRKINGRVLNFIFALIAVAVIVVAWVIAYYCVGNDYVLPSVGDSVVALFACFADGAFWVAFGNTLLRTLYAFVISFVLAAVFASLSSVYPPFGRVFSVIMSFVRTLPTMAVTLMLLIWTSPLVAPVVVCVLVLFPMIYSQFHAAICAVDGDLLQMAHVYGIGKKERLTKIIAPQVAPAVLSEVGADLSFGLKLMVSAEVLSYTARSLGGMMQQARLSVEMPTFAALTIMCILAGLVLEWLSSYLNLLTAKWRAKEAQSEN